MMYMMHNVNEKLYSEADYRMNMLNTIRRDKFDFILPEAMRESNLDMWIHVIRRGSDDPFKLDFGVDMGYCIFTDTGDARIERALFGIDFATVADASLYDKTGTYEEMIEYILEKKPNQIGINQSSKLSHFDSLSHTDYVKLTDRLGDAFSGSLVSAEKAITLFRGRRVSGEIALYGYLMDIQRRIIMKGLRSIIPGKTTRRELSLFGNAELLASGLEPNLLHAVPPNIMYSDKFDLKETEDLDYILQKGDFLFWDWGYERINVNYGLDFKRSIYLLKDSETDLPEGAKEAWQWVLKARDILRKTVVSGRTAQETIEDLIAKFEETGFIHTPFDQIPEEIVDDLGDNPKPGISIDFHTVGNAGTCYEVGTAIAPQRSESHKTLILDNQLIAFEFMVNFYVDQWGKRVLFDYEENAVITQDGCQFMSPVNDQILLGK